MNISAAGMGSLPLSPEELQKIARLREAAVRHPVREGSKPTEAHHAALGGFDCDFFLWVDAEGESAQYRLQVIGPEGQPPLETVQALARHFFDTIDFQVMPDEFNPFRVRVMGLFFPYLPAVEEKGGA